MAMFSRCMYIVHIYTIYIYVLYIDCNFVIVSHGRQVKEMRKESEKSDVDESSSLLKVCVVSKES